MDISSALTTLQQQRQDLEAKVNMNSMEFSARFVQVIHTEDSLETITRAIDWIEQYVDDLGIALASLAQGKLPPSMFPQMP